MPSRPEVIHGAESLDDAGVMDLGDGRGLVQTIDFFPPIVDDAFDYGRIAAANALSDIYAMGGQPFSALNVVGFPIKTLPREVLGEILAGGAEVIAESGAALLGGHSVEDAEIKYGLAVSGLIQIEDIVTNGGAVEGDVLILSKPLGMGAVTTSMQMGKEDPAHIAAAVKSMATLNSGAAEAAIKVGCHSMTDVTGFGLMGHASEIARASNMTLTFEASSLPLSLGAYELAKKGWLSGGASRTQKFLGDLLGVADGVDESIVKIALDAETSGGLLMAVPEEKAAQLLDLLKEKNTPCAKIIGRVEAKTGKEWVKLS